MGGSQGAQAWRRAHARNRSPLVRMTFLGPGRPGTFDVDARTVEDPSDEACE